MKFLTQQQAAERLGVSLDAVRIWCRSGALRSARLGESRVVRISEEDLTAFYEGRIR